MTPERIAELRREFGSLNPRTSWHRAVGLELLDEVDRLRAASAPAGGGVPEIPTWDDCSDKACRGEKLTALEKFVMDHDWHKTDRTFRDGLEAVFDEIRAGLASRLPALKPGEVEEPPRAWLNPKELEVAIGGRYQIPDGRDFWIDGPVARQIAGRVASSSRAKARATDPALVAAMEECREGTHDWRYASTYRRPGYESRARCEWCQERKWDPVGPQATTNEGGAEHG